MAHYDSSLQSKHCPVCNAELEKVVYNNFADGYQTVQNLIDIFLLIGGDNRELNKVKHQAYESLKAQLFDETGQLKVDYEFLLYCMVKLRENGK